MAKAAQVVVSTAIRTMNVSQQRIKHCIYMHILLHTSDSLAAVDGRSSRSHTGKSKGSNSDKRELHDVKGIGMGCVVV